jgi:hypothetical protein
MAEEGSLKERGRSPLSDSLPSNKIVKLFMKTGLFEGDQGGN